VSLLIYSRTSLPASQTHPIESCSPVSHWMMLQVLQHEQKAHSRGGNMQSVRGPIRHKRECCCASEGPLISHGLLTHCSNAVGVGCSSVASPAPTALPPTSSPSSSFKSSHPSFHLTSQPSSCFLGSTLIILSLFSLHSLLPVDCSGA
jgi:hypothetical protein